MKRRVVTRDHRRSAVRAGTGLAICLAATLGGCIAKAPKGQVVAVVNGQEITGQDLLSEQRSVNVANADPRALLQRVVARALLAQSAHDRKLDAYPGFPSDILRLRQDFLAQKLLHTDIKAPPAPSQAQVDAFIAAHPYVFAQRGKLTLDELRFRAMDDLKSLGDTDSLDAIQARLKALSADVQRGSRTVDTAQLPPQLADKLMSTPIGKVFFIKDRDATVAAAVTDRSSTPVPAAQQQALARQLMGQLATQQEIDAKVKSLRSAAKITYQPGYAPPAAPAAASGAAPGAAPATNAPPPQS